MCLKRFPSLHTKRVQIGQIGGCGRLASGVARYTHPTHTQMDPKGSKPDLAAIGQIWPALAGNGQLWPDLSRSVQKGLLNPRGVGYEFLSSLPSGVRNKKWFIFLCFSPCMTLRDQKTVVSESAVLFPLAITIAEINAFYCFYPLFRPIFVHF